MVAARIASSPRSSPIAPRAATHDFAHERVGAGRRRQRHEPGEHDVVDVLALAARPGGDLGDHRIGVVERLEQGDAGMAGGDRRGAAADCGVDIAEGDGDVAVVGDGEPFESAEGCRPHPGISRAEPGAGRCGITLVPGQGHGAAGRLDAPLNPSAGSSSS